MKKLSILVIVAFCKMASAQMHEALAPGAKDTNRICPFIIVGGGLSSPQGYGYGGSFYDATSHPYPYSGYAGKGELLSVSGGLKFASGFAITGAFGYYIHSFDANGYFNENMAFVLHSRDTKSGSIIDGNSVSTTGTYHYNDRSFLLGISKGWGAKRFQFGLALMGGVMSVTRPAINSRVNVREQKNNVSDTATYNWEIDKYTGNRFLMNFSIYVDVNINKHFFMRGAIDYELSSFPNPGAFQLTDNSGNVIDNGNLSEYQYTSNLAVGIADFTIGVGYRFKK